MLDARGAEEIITGHASVLRLAVDGKRQIIAFESVSRALTTLRSQRVIALPDPHRIVVLDSPRLRELGIVESGLD